MTPAGTAIRRSGPSKPAREIYRLAGWALSRQRVLDYGCGHGADATHYGLEKWDPNWYPYRPVGIFDAVLCTYVLNVVPPEEESTILKDILSLLKPGGIAYTTVRRDGPFKGVQRNVVLDYPILVTNKKFCTYIVTPK